MHTVGLIAPAVRGDAMVFAQRTTAFLLENGIQVLCEEDVARRISGCTVIGQTDAVPDAYIALGGDGTLLRAAQFAVKSDAPLLGINLGRVGFLTEIEPDSLESALKALLCGEYAIDRRAMLEIRVEGLGAWRAMNDAVISRGGYARLITMRTLVDGEETGRSMADGVIVATPTGSTGYSLSAGGPIVSPHVDCMVITPVCAHSLQHRPTVVPGTAVIRLELETDEQMTASLQVDGQSCALLHAGQAVEIRRADVSVKLVRLRENRFFDVVRKKLVEWSC